MLDPQIKWVLPSSDGWNNFVITPVDTWTDQQGGKRLFVSVQMDGKFWDRKKLANDDLDSANVRDDYSVFLPQVIFSNERILELLQLLKNWLVELNDIQIELSDISDQSFYILLGENKNFVSEGYKRVFTVKYSCSRMVAGEWSYIVDQSCIQIFISSLEKYMYEGSNGATSQ